MSVEGRESGWGHAGALPSAAQQSCPERVLGTTGGSTHTARSGGAQGPQQHDPRAARPCDLSVEYVLQGRL